MPDIQLLFIAGSLAAAPYLPPFRNVIRRQFRLSHCAVAARKPWQCYAWLGGSASPSAHPPGGCCCRRTTGKHYARALPCSASRPADLNSRRSSRARSGLASTPPRMRKLRPYTRQTAVTAHHPAGTCKMGRGSMIRWRLSTTRCACVASNSFRVVDASVFPDLVGGNINAPVIMIGGAGSRVD